LLKGKAAVIQEVPRRCDAVIRRASRLGWLTDFERALQILVELGVTLVLDL
jgi:hypothetical protein